MNEASSVFDAVDAGVDLVTGESVVTAETYARWRASTLGSITERVETKVVFALTRAPQTTWKTGAILSA